MSKSVLFFISILFYSCSSSYAQNSQDPPLDLMEEPLHVEQLIPTSAPLEETTLAENFSRAIIRHQNSVFYGTVNFQEIDSLTLQIIAAWFSGVDMIPYTPMGYDADDHILDERDPVWTNVDDTIFQDETKNIVDFNKLRMQGEILNDEVVRLIGVIITRHNKRVTADNLIRMRPERTDMIDLFFQKFIEKGLLKDPREALCYRKYLFPREEDEVE